MDPKEGSEVERRSPPLVGDPPLLTDRDEERRDEPYWVEQDHLLLPSLGEDDEKKLMIAYTGTEEQDIEKAKLTVRCLLSQPGGRLIATRLRGSQPNHRIDTTASPMKNPDGIKEIDEGTGGREK